MLLSSSMRNGIGRESSSSRIFNVNRQPKNSISLIYDITFITKTIFMILNKIKAWMSIVPGWQETGQHEVMFLYATWYPVPR
jgi:hypothetical protein